MSYQRILMIINLLLVGVCGFAVYYLQASDYSSPDEITNAETRLKEIEAILEGDETTFNVRNETSMNRQSDNRFTRVERAVAFTPLYTPTPTPKPTPPPPPPDGNLAEAVEAWTLSQLVSDSAVVFTDTRTKNDISMEVGGVPYNGQDKKGRPVEIRLSNVDMATLTATLSYKDQTVDKAF